MLSDERVAAIRAPSASAVTASSTPMMCHDVGAPVILAKVSAT